MVWLRDTVNIFGVITRHLKVILSKVTGMVMVSGSLKEVRSSIKVIIYWIESMDMVFTIGEIILFIKGNILKIYEQVRGSFIVTGN